MKKMQLGSDNRCPPQREPRARGTGTPLFLLPKVLTGQKMFLFLSVYPKLLQGTTSGVSFFYATTYLSSLSPKAHQGGILNRVGVYCGLTFNGSF